MRKILFGILMFANTFCHSDWTLGKDIDIANYDGEFYAVDCKKKGGFQINAYHGSSDQDVKLRLIDTKVDYEIDIRRTLSMKTCNIYLNLLDEDNFLIKSILLGAFSENYRGETFGEFNIQREKFNEVKYFSFTVMLIKGGDN